MTHAQLDICAPAAYDITIVFTATDACGNSSTVDAVVTVEPDVIDPVLTEPTDIVLDCDDISGTSDPAAIIDSLIASVTATDNCDPNVNITHTFDSAQLDICAPAAYDITIVFTATDACGNSSTVDAVITVEPDVIDPVLTEPTDIVLDCDDLSGTSDPAAIIDSLIASVTATDNCDPNVSITHTFDSAQLDICAPTAYDITIVFTATDACGNSSTVDAVITVEPDVIDPVLTEPTDIVLDCDDLSGTSDPAAIIDSLIAAVTATDNCDPNVSITHTFDAAQLDICAPAAYDITIVFTATDACGNSSTVDAVITVEPDVIDPVLTEPTDIVLDCDDLSGTSDPAAIIDSLIAAVTATDNCDPNVSLTHTFDSAQLDICAPAAYDITIVFTATDACGNSSTVDAVITVEPDVVDPVLTEPTDIVLDCDDLSGTSDPAAIIDSLIAAVTATDNCDPNVSITHTFDAAQLDICAPAAYDITIVFTATDACGNSSTVDAVITVEPDVIDPVLTEPTDIVLDCDDLSGTSDPAAIIDSLIAAVTATDNCDPNVSLTHTFDSAQLDICAPAAYDITIVFTATDACGNSSTVDAVITVEPDVVDPVLTEPTDIVLDCDDLSGTSDPAAQIDSLIAAVTATDNCDPNVSLTHTFDAAQLDICAPAAYDITIVFTATDACGNSSTVDAVITVEPDVLDPVLTEPVDIVLDCDDISGTSDPAAQIDSLIAAVTATDNCDPNVSLTHTFDIAQLDICAPAAYDITIVFTATDACGNSSTVDAIVTIEPDVLAPVLTEPVDIVLDCDDISGTSDPAAIIDSLIASVTATDNCDPNVNLTHTIDNPQIDVCAPAPYDITIVFTATDACGNSSTVDAVITIEPDVLAPVLTEPVDIVLDCDDISGTSDPAAQIDSLIAAVTATDNCDPNVSLTHTFDAAQLDICAPAAYDITIVFTATDACGNSSTVDAVITVEPDVIDPVLTEPVDIVLDCDDISGTSDPAAIIDSLIAAVTATDNCDPNVSLTHTFDSAQLDICAPAAYDITIVFTATDACGNSSTVDAVITVEPDVIDPVLTEPVDIVLDCDDISGTSDPAAQIDSLIAGVTATDNCDPNVSLTHTFDAAQLDICAPAAYDITIVFTATDACGNSSTVDAVITVEPDVIDPVLTEPVDIVLDCDDISGTSDPAAQIDSLIAAVTATDNCDPNVSLTHTFDSAQLDICAPAAYDITIVFTATDACGNSSTVDAVITVEPDVIDPVLTEPVDIVLDCDDISGTSDPAAQIDSLIAAVTATDNCDPNVSLTHTFDAAQLDICADAAYDITIVFTATDACGNSSTVDAVITVEPDVIDPVLTEPVDIVLDCDDISGTSDPAAQIDSLIAAVTATDNCDPNVSLTHTFDAAQLDICADAAYDITIVFTATDACGNSSTVDAVITVEPDVIDPVLTEPVDIVLDCDDISGTSDPAAQIDSLIAAVTATDNCDPNVSLTHTFDAAQLDICADAAYDITIVFTATDACGNSSTVDAVITVEPDVIDPVLTEPVDIVLDCDDISGTSDPAAQIDSLIAAVTATDNCDPNVSLTHTFDIAQLDICAPAAYDITIVFTATDACGNSSTVDAIVTIEPDVIAPVLTEPTDIVLDCEDLSGTSDPAAQIDSLIAAVTATDNCDPNVSLTHTFDIAQLDICAPAAYDITIVFTATDACGNSSTVDAIVTIEPDVIAPVLTEPTDIVLDCEDLSGTSDPAAQIDSLIAAVTATDNCDPNVSLTHTFDIAQLDICAPAAYDITIVFTATDACGNSSTVDAVITIEPDVVPPVLTEPVDIVLDCDDISGTSDPAAQIDSLIAAVTATDNCDPNVSLTHTFDIAQLDICAPAAYDITIVFTATDACGNSSTVDAVITIEPDVVPPVLVEPVDITLDCDDISGTSDPAAQIDSLIASVTATDNCDPNVNLTHTIDNAQLDICADAAYDITIVFTATDACGNSSTVDAIVTVEPDVVPPVLVEPVDITLDCDDISGTSDPAAQIDSLIASVTATDNCDPNVNLTHTIDNAQLDICADAAYDITIVFTATDACGNSSTVDAIVTVEPDVIPPVITPPAGITLDCSVVSETTSVAAALDSLLGEVVVTDNCDTDPVVNYSFDSSLIDICAPQPYDLTVTWSAFDECGNEAVEVTTTITIQPDTEAPIVSAPEDISIDCDIISSTTSVAAVIDSLLAEASVTDDCDTDPVLTHDFSGALLDICAPAPYDITITFTGTDACGNAGTDEVIMTIIPDTEPPVITVEAANIEVVCDGDNNITELLDWLNANGGADATDNCTEVEWSNDYGMVDPGACQGTGSITVTFTATDVCGNTSTTTGTITILDTVPPFWTIDPVDVTFECNDSIDPYMQIDSWLDAVGFGDASDSCSVVSYSHNFNGLTPTCGPGSNAGFATVVFTAMDACGNFTTREATVTVVDMTRPAIANPAIDTTVECNGLGNIADLQSWLDNNGGASWRDACGEFTPNPPILVNTLEGCGLTVEYTYAFTATDVCGNVSDTTIGIFIIEDTTPPVIDPDAMDMTVECDGTGNDAELDAWLANMANAGATDVCSDDPLDVEYDLVMEEDSCGITGIQVYRFTFTDNCGNSITTEGTFTIEDTTPPVLTGGEDYSGECDQSGANNDDELLSWLNNNAGITAEDGCNNFVWSNNYHIDNWVDGCNDSRSIDVTFYATDECGNVDSLTFNFSTGDNTPPVFTNCPRPPVIVDAPVGWCSSFVNFSQPLAIDNCGVPIVEQTDTTGLMTGDLFPVGLTILEFTATDSCGNSTMCEIKVVVNDFHTPPVIECPSDTIAFSDPGVCGAVINDIAPVSIEDNCPDHVAVVYTVKDELGVVIEEGIEDASGSVIPVGENTVCYVAYDQPIVLITEILQDGSTSGVEISNLGPAAMNLSCATITRIVGTDTLTYIIPNGTIIGVGDVFIHEFMPADIQGDEATYTLSFLERTIDQISINDGILDGDNIIRIDPVDNDDDSDWQVVNPCQPGSYGMYNPELPVFMDNGSLTSLQSEAPSADTCTFMVTVIDIEAPSCATQDSMTTEINNITLSNNACITSEITVGPGIVGDVNVRDLVVSISNAGAFSALLTSPEGTTIQLFNNLCDGTANIHVDLDDQAASSILGAGCDPLGNGAMYKPIQAFKTFVGEEAEGTWTLSVYVDENIPAIIESWILDVITNVPYQQMDTTLENDTMLCSAEFSWVHPVFNDNCCEGTMTVTYSFTNDVTGESYEITETILSASGFVDLDGTLVTRVFDVGVTEVSYTLTDLAGNVGFCGFTVTVLDTEAPVFPDGCPSFTFGLEAGECTAALSTLPSITDNCAIDTVTFCDASGDPIDIFALPIGVNEITIKATDIYGNVGTCTFIADVREFEPTDNSLNCNNSINLSLGPDCTAEVTADMFLEGGGYGCYDNYCITIMNENGTIPHDNFFDLSDVGQTFQVTITDCLGSNNSCWGYINIEEKLIPEILCPPDTVLACNVDPEARDQAGRLLTGELEVLSCEEIVDISYQDLLENYGDCSDPRAEIKRRWRLEDEDGNVVICDQIISFLPYNPSNVVWPNDFFADSSLYCGDVLNDNTLTQPQYTGTPTINGLPVNGHHFCDVNVGYEDLILYDANCPTAYEILRTWYIRDECQPLFPGINPYTHIQSIKVNDNEAPHLLPVDDITVGTDPLTCRGSIILPELVHEDDCSGHKTLWYASYGRVVNDTILTNLVKGVTQVTGLVKDDCGNIAQASFTVTVLDLAAPVAVTKKDIVASLTPSGPNGESTAKLYVESFDNGSFDNCSDVYIEIRRDANAPDCTNLGLDDYNNNITFDNTGHVDDDSLDTDSGQYVKFCCEDITRIEGDANEDGMVDSLDAGYVKVIVRVWDDANMSGFYGDNVAPFPGVAEQQDNYNEAWAWVKVECKAIPVISCPPEDTVQCFWDVSFDPSAGWRKVSDYDLSKTGFATAFGCCGPIEVEFSDAGNIPDCQEGTFVRTFRAGYTSIDGQQQYVQCQQRITILRDDYVVTVTPKNRDFANPSCTFDESIIDQARPTINGGPCDVIGEYVTVDTFLFENGVCKKWRITYEYWNWCKQEAYGPFTEYAIYEDTDDPVIMTCQDTCISVDANCEALVTLTNAAYDISECTDNEWIKWVVEIDLWADGSIDAVAATHYTQRNWTPVSDPWYGAIQVINLPGTASKDSVNQPMDQLSDDQIATITFPEVLDGKMSNHKVTWKAIDGCHNEAGCSYNVMVTDKKAPTPYCVSLSSAIMDDGTVELWAKDFDRGSFDNCTPQEDLLYTFNEMAGAFKDTVITFGGRDYLVNADIPQFFDEDGFVGFDGDGVVTDANGNIIPAATNANLVAYGNGDIQRWRPDYKSSAKVFDCDEYNAQGPNGYQVMMTVWDKKCNYDFCLVFLSLIDNQGGCDPNAPRVSGTIITDNGSPLEQTVVTIEGDVNDITKVTVGNGAYEFQVPAGVNYEVSAEKDVDYMNGVSTLDLVLIQRHILGLAELDTEYKWISADVNNDMQIRANDLVELRKLILGITNDFTATSWKLVDAKEDIEMSTPLQYSEIVSVPNLQADVTDADFIATKVGDVSGDAQSNARGEVVENRNRGTVHLIVEDQEVVAGQPVDVAVTSSNFTAVYGYQFTSGLNGLALTGVRSGAIEMNDNHVGLPSLDMMTASWASDEMVSAIDGEVLFTIEFVATKSGKLSEMLTLNSAITRAESYTGEGMEVGSIDLTFRTETSTADVLRNALYQNEPNPFKGMTKIGYELVEGGEATFTMYDVTGKVLYTRTVEAERGMNTLEISSDELGVSGIVYYKIESGDFVATKKMIVLK